MKSFISLMLCVSIAGYAFAQKLPFFSEYSKYTFDLEKGNRLLIMTPSMVDLEKYQNIDSTLALFVRDFKKTKPALSESIHSRMVRYEVLPNGQYQLNITEHPQNRQSFRFNATNTEPVLLKTVQDTLLIIQQFSKIWSNHYNQKMDAQVFFCFTLNNLEEIEDLVKTGTVNAHIRKAIEDTKKYLHHDLKNEKMQFNYQQNTTGGVSFKNVGLKRGDFLAIHQTFGVGVFRNQLVPNSQTEFAFVPSKYHNVGYTLGWRSMFWSSRDEQTGRWRTNSNGVLQAGVTFYDFKRSTVRVDTGHVLFGVYLGRVMTRDGDIFERNTWNLSMTVAARGIVKIQPEVYFNGFFSRNVMPGLRVQVGF